MTWFKYQPPVVVPPLRNPVALAAVCILAMARGTVWLLSTANVGNSGITPRLPAVAIAGIGAAWIAAGVILFAALFLRKYFLLAVSIMVGMYCTWIMVHAVDMITSPDLDSAISVVTYAVLIPVIITLDAAEMEPAVSGGAQ